MITTTEHASFVKEMEVKILGAHNAETKKTRLISLLIDNMLAIDAGALTSSLSLTTQRKIRAILLTHHHFDHVRDLVTLGMNAAFGPPVAVHALKKTIEVLNLCLLDGKIYVDFAQFPSKENPSLQFFTVEPHKEEVVEGYKITPLSVKHPIPTVGYQVVSPEGKSLFYTADTGPGVSECWNHISPQLLITEVSGINEWTDKLQAVGHLNAQLLKEELLQFRKLKGYLPRIVAIHITPQVEEQIKEEVRQLAIELGADISVGYEGMVLNI